MGSDPICVPHAGEMGSDPIFVPHGEAWGRTPFAGAADALLVGMLVSLFILALVVLVAFETSEIR